MKHVFCVLTLIAGCHCGKSGSVSSTTVSSTPTSSSSSTGVGGAGGDDFGGYGGDPRDALDAGWQGRWDVLPSLTPTEGRWGDSKMFVYLDSRHQFNSEGKAWPYPYPWHLALVTNRGDAYDCGVMEELFYGKWRTAFCRGGAWGDKVRQPVKLYMYEYELPKSMRLRIEVLGIFKIEVERAYGTGLPNVGPIPANPSQ